MISALTPIPVLGVPIESKKLKGLDSLLSIAQMPKGIPVGTLAIGEDGAINAGLLAASIIAIEFFGLGIRSFFDRGFSYRLDLWAGAIKNIAQAISSCFKEERLVGCSRHSRSAAQLLSVA